MWQPRFERINRIICIGLLVGAIVCAVPILYLRLNVFFAERELERQLLTIDAFFDTPRPVLPASATDDSRFPPQVGKFQRSSLRPGSFCAYVIRCLWITYDGPNGQYVSLIARESSQQASAIMRNMVRPEPCAAELGGEIRLRNEAKQPYLYRICYTFFVGAPYLMSITWPSDMWLIEISGSEAANTSFLVDYPF
jgi:hypothetical protein